MLFALITLASIAFIATMAVFNYTETKTEEQKGDKNGTD